jgi:hypothetical protein
MTGLDGGDAASGCWSMKILEPQYWQRIKLSLGVKKLEFLHFGQEIVFVAML